MIAADSNPLDNQDFNSFTKNCFSNEQSVVSESPNSLEKSKKRRKRKDRVQSVGDLTEVLRDSVSHYPRKQYEPAYLPRLTII